MVGIYSNPARYAINQYPDGNVVQYVSIAFECERDHGELRISDESTEVGYFATDGLPEKMLPSHRIRVQDALANRPEPFLR